MPRTCHGIKVWNQCYSLSIFNKIFCSHTLCILEYMLKKNVQVRHCFMDLVTSVEFLDCFPLFFRSFLNQHFSVPFKQILPWSCFCIFFVHAVIRHISLHSLWGVLLWALHIGYIVKFKSHTIQSELSVLHFTAGDDFSVHAAYKTREVISTHSGLHETQTAAFLFSFGGVLVVFGLYYSNIMNILYHFVCRFCNKTFMTCVNVYVPGSVHSDVYALFMHKSLDLYI